MDNLANILTVGRLFLLPPLVIFLFLPYEWALWASLIIYITGAVTDFLDGWVARRFDQVSEFGKFMDPVADKIFVVTILLMLIATGRIEGLWVLPVIIILVREFLVSGLREFLGPKNIKLPVTSLAKWKTAVQMIATGLLIIAPLAFWVQITGLLGLTAAAVMTAITGWQYLQAGIKHIGR